MFEKQFINPAIFISTLCSVATCALFAYTYTQTVPQTSYAEETQPTSSQTTSTLRTDYSESRLTRLRRGANRPTTPQPPIIIASSTPSMTPPPLIPVSQTPIPSSPTLQTTEVMAWLYPGVPACFASTEIADGRNIHVLKAEYFTINAAGTLTLLPEAKAGCNGYSLKNVALLKQFSVAQYVTVSISSASTMELFLKGNTTDAVDTLVTFVTTEKLTGIELDFEDFGSWSLEQYSLYKSFVTLLGNTLHSQGKKLIIDGPAVANAAEEDWFVWRYEDFLNLPVDQIVVMAYDHQYDEGVGSAISPFIWMENVIKWTMGKYPNSSKIVVGLPSYGYRGVQGTQKITILTYDQIMKELGFSTATRDPLSGEMTWKSGTTRYFYQDKESLRQKQALVEKMGLHSISVWHLGGNLWF